MDDIHQTFERLELYLGRVRRDITSSDFVQARANCAELHEIAGRFWTRLGKEVGRTAACGSKPKSICSCSPGRVP